MRTMLMLDYCPFYCQKMRRVPGMIKAINEWGEINNRLWSAYNIQYLRNILQYSGSKPGWKGKIVKHSLGNHLRWTPKEPRPAKPAQYWHHSNLLRVAGATQDDKMRWPRIWRGEGRESGRRQERGRVGERGREIRGNGESTGRKVEKRMQITFPVCSTRVYRRCRDLDVISSRVKLSLTIRFSKHINETRQRFWPTDSFPETF